MKNPQTAWFHLVHINFVSGSSFPHSVQWDALVALKKTKLLFHLTASGLPVEGVISIHLLRVLFRGIAWLLEPSEKLFSWWPVELSEGKKDVRRSNHVS